MIQDFLLEIGTEPLPARFIASAAEQLERGLRQAIERHSLQTPQTSYKTFATLVLGGFDNCHRRVFPERTGCVKGPPKKLPAARRRLSRRRRWACEETGCQARGLSRWRVLYAEIRAPGEETAIILARIIPELLRAPEFPKSLNGSLLVSSAGRSADCGAVRRHGRADRGRWGQERQKDLGVGGVAHKPITLKSPAATPKPEKGRVLERGREKGGTLGAAETAATEAGGALT